MAMQGRTPLTVLLALVGMLSLTPNNAFATKGDAIRAADFAARTAVQTIYHNLITQGYEWRWIRDEKMPDILMKAVRAIDRQSQTMDKDLVVRYFIPTYVSAYYDEIAKINAQNRVECLDITFVVRTMVPFLDVCKKELADLGDFAVLVDAVVHAEYTFKVCQTLAACQEQLSDKFYVIFGERRPADNFYNVCTGEFF